ncbi:methionine--tRNA ligase mes1 [Bonamia ostreae]|uniref:Methionine--tRNA ligase mes1 n=1 Tax=Bonamia ostreae TaxID=126728 RepID=A0ABV2AM59_9EUKA
MLSMSFVLLQKETGIPASVWRYYLLSVRPENSDSNFDWDDLAMKANNELNNNVGNFVNRVFKFIATKFNGQVPELGKIGKNDFEFIGYFANFLQISNFKNLSKSRKSK